MSRRSNEVLVPRNGHTLVVGIGARISGCANQKEMSLDDQIDHAKEVVAEMYDGPVEYRIIATKGKGEALDRPELGEIEAALRKGDLDLFIWEDLGRLVRGSEAARLLGIGVDNGTRTLVPNDCIDTAEDTWEQDALQACAEHVGHNAHTSKRLKYKLMNRFVKFGGATARPIYGYIIPEDAKTYSDWQKDPQAVPTIVEGARRLKQSLNCSAVADWFNQKNVPTGPYCRRKTWDGKMVRRFYSTTLLKGMPSRGTRWTVKRHETGRRVSVKNPNGPRFRECPHLAHLDPVEFDELNALLIKANADFGRKPVNGIDPRHQVPRKRTRFPGQHGRCWYCGRQHVWGGNGVAANLMCSGAREWICWNSIGYNGELAVQKVSKAILAELYALDGFDQQFQDFVQRACLDSGAGLSDRQEKLKTNEAALAIERRNIQAAIVAYGANPLVKQMMDELQTKEQKVAQERHELNRLQTRPLDLPTSSAALRGMLEQQFQTLSADSPEFGNLLRQLVPEFCVYLVRLCDGGHLLPRARVTLALDGFIPDARQVPGLSQMLTRKMTLDLFIPPQRERIREQVVSLTSQGFKPKEIAQRIAEEAIGPGAEKPTVTAVQNALALDRKMRAMGLTSPYLKVLAPPADYPKLRRHENAKYRFGPLEGYQPLAI